MAIKSYIPVNKNQASENRERYKVAPSIEQLNSVLKYMRTKDSILEIVWLMPTGTLKRVRYSGRQIPSPYWHLFYIVLWLRNEYNLPPAIKKK